MIKTDVTLLSANDALALILVLLGKRCALFRALEPTVADIMRTPDPLAAVLLQHLVLLLPDIDVGWEDR